MNFLPPSRGGEFNAVNDNVVNGLIDKAGIVSQLLLPELQEDPSPDRSGYPATGCRRVGGHVTEKQWREEYERIAGNSS
ncbi:hypothetical protein ATE47_18780 [Chryseobacterium sp. IHB B 17019]|nr:hypothetical protein ATE47_00035 [Chryseobacterium sp. IHB B 17019]ALR32421.1 hypothetical protein ATE47_18780 [Chryseobacterium sp. IHB B 17019]